MSRAELPEGWVSAPLGEVASAIQYGYTASAEPGGTGPRLLRITDIQDGNVDWSSVPSCTIEPGALERYRLAFGDIVFARSGATTGKSFLIEKCPVDAVFASYLIRVRASHDVLTPKYLSFAFQTPQYWAYVSDNLAGNAQPNCNGSKLSSLPVPIAPLPEQHRIVAKVEALLDRVTQATARLDRASLILKWFRQSVLAAACSGELTRDWRIANNVSPPTGGVEARNEAGWPLVRASDACALVQSGGTPKGKPFSQHGDIPFLKIYNIVNQQVSFSERRQFIPRHVHETELGRSVVRPGDVLMNIVGPPLGKVAIVLADYSEWNINQAIVAFRPKETLRNTFLYYVLCEGSAIRSIESEYRGSAGQVNISLSQARAFSIPVPSLSEQDEIVRRVKDLFALADAIARRIQAAKTRADRLPRATLSKAFAGELVPTEAELARAQGRTYETAEDLLARAMQSAAANRANVRSATKGPVSPGDRRRAQRA